MTKNNTQSSSFVPDFESDFTHYAYAYFGALLRRWKFILGSIVIAVVATVIIIFALPRTYMAEADVSLLDVRSSVIFDPQFMTVPSEGVAQQNDTRKAALEALATSEALSAELFAQLTAEEALEQKDFRNFRSALETEVVGDLLKLQVTWDDPSMAATIANAWAQMFIQLANRSYISTSSQSPREAQATAGEAFQEYQVAQQELEAFIAENEITDVQRAISETGKLIDELQERKVDTLLLANTTVISANQRLANTLYDTLSEQAVFSVERRMQDRTRELNDWYERRVILERLLVRLGDLQEQIKSGNISAAAASGDALALIFTRAGLFGQEQVPELLLQLDLGQLSEEGGDLDEDEVASLMEIAQVGLDEANSQIEKLSEQLFLGAGLVVSPTIPADHEMFANIEGQVSSMLNTDLTTVTNPTTLEASPLNQTLLQLSKQRQTLRAQAESLQARERELTHGRNAAWDFYTTLENKALEVEAQFATGASQVRLALQARSPATPESRGFIRAVIIAAFLGGFVGIVYVLVDEFQQVNKEDTTSTMTPQDPHSAAN